MEVKRLTQLHATVDCQNAAIQRRRERARPDDFFAAGLLDFFVLVLGDFLPLAFFPEAFAPLDLRPLTFPRGALLAFVAPDFLPDDFPRLPPVDFFAAETLERDPALVDFLRLDVFDGAAFTLLAVEATLLTAFFT